MSRSGEKSRAYSGSPPVTTDETKSVVPDMEVHRIMNQIEDTFKDELPNSQIEKIKSIVSSSLKHGSDHDSLTTKVKPSTSFNLSSDKGSV